MEKRIWYQWSVFLVLAQRFVCGGMVVNEIPPKPKPWPEQFHALLYQNRSGSLATVDLWYDYPNGRNFNIIQHQLGSVLRDLEWTNGTSFYYDLQAETCKTVHFSVGILRPDWLVGNSTYIGVKEMDGFVCNVWTKADEFLFYYEDVVSGRPVHWQFHTGMMEHVITFEPGKVLQDSEWQAPWYCFKDTGGARSVIKEFYVAINNESQN